MSSLFQLFSLFLSLLPLVQGFTSGEVSLWSNSDCGQGDTTSFGEKNPVTLNYTLDIDTCGNPGATVHSYTVTQRPTCANGKTANFAFYHGANCQVEGFGSALNQDDASRGADGLCLALVEFNSVAFICNGLGVAGPGLSTVSASSGSTSNPSTTPTPSATPTPSTTPTPSITPTPSTTPVASGTTTSLSTSTTTSTGSLVMTILSSATGSSASVTSVVPGSSMTPSNYTTVPTSIVSKNLSSTGTASSATLPAQPSVSIITGAADRVTWSLLRVLAVVGAALSFSI